MDSSGSAPGWPSTSASSASTSSGSTLRPTRSAGRSIARASSSRDIGADEHVVGAEQARQLGVRGAAAVEVGAHGQHHDAVFIARDTHEAGDELGPLRLVRAGGEQLLELVDREDTAPFPSEPAGCAAKLAQRPLARPDQRLRPAVAPRQDAAREGGQQPGPQHRRLAAPRRSDDREQRCADQARDQLGDQPLASEEVLGVRGVERRQALVRADRRRDGDVAVGADQAGALASRLQLDDPAGELLLERAGLAAAGRRATGRRVDAACGLASRPLGGGLVNLRVRSRGSWPAASRRAPPPRRPGRRRRRSPRRWRRRAARARAPRPAPVVRVRRSPAPWPARAPAGDGAPARDRAAPSAPRRARGRHRRPRPAPAAAARASGRSPPAPPPGDRSRPRRRPPRPRDAPRRRSPRPDASCPSRTRRRSSPARPHRPQRASSAPAARAARGRARSAAATRTRRARAEAPPPPARRPATGPGAGSRRAGAAARATARRRSPRPACACACR